MVMQSLRSGVSGGFLKYILLGLLGMAVGGLVLTDIGSSYQGSGMGGNDVLSVGSNTLDINEFDQSFRRTAYQYGVSVQQAYKMGVTKEVLSTEITKMVVSAELEKLGLNVDKELIAKRVASFIKPRAQGGESIQEAFDRVLQQLGMSEAQFAAEIESDVFAGLLVDTINAGMVNNNDLLVQDLYRFRYQTRDIDMLVLSDSILEDPQTPTDEQVSKLYDSLKNLKYKTPEYRSAHIATLDPADIPFSIEIKDEDLQSAYEKNMNAYKIGEQFVVSQAMVKDAQQAQDIYEAVKSGDDLKTATIKILGDETKYYERVAFETNMLLPALKTALADREIGTVVAPVETMLGHHILILKEILEPSYQPLENVKSALKAEILEEEKAEYFYQMLSDFEDALSNGSTLENMKQKNENLKLSEIAFVDHLGLDNDKQDGLSVYTAEDRKILIEALFELDGKDYPYFIEEMPSGVFAIMTLKETRAEHFKALESVREEIITQFIADQKHADNAVKAQKYLAEISTGGSTLNSIAQGNGLEVRHIPDIKIDEGNILPEPLTEKDRPIIFQTPLNDHAILEFDNAIALIKISGYSLPSLEAEKAEEQIAEIANIFEQKGADGSFKVYIQALSEQYDIQINEGLLKQAYGQGE